MEKTLAQLKKDLQNKSIALVMVRRYGEEENIPERLKGQREVIKTQSNGVYLSTPNIKGNTKGSWLDYPKAAQLVYTDDELIIYGVGERDYNEKELAALEEWKKITETKDYKKNAYYDAMTDCSITFYQKKLFWKSKGMEYMLHIPQGGLRRTYNNKIKDNSLRGSELFAYKVIHLA